MLTEKCLQKEWIVQQAKNLKARDPQLVETCIYALELVGRMVEADLDFVFKGGTSLLLHIQPLKRVSIDVDIATPVDMRELERVLKKVCRPPFGEYVYQDWRDRENPPTRHFHIPYSSPIKGKTWPLQLDVLLGDVTYPKIESKPITLSMIEAEKDIEVNVPSIECLLGDKLTAFAPKTIGVLYDPPPRKPGAPKPVPKPIRVLKQLFDVGELFNIANDLNIVSEAYDKLFIVQNKARGGTYTREQALEDSIDAAYWISQLDLRNQEINTKTDFMRSGIKALNSHILGPTFSITTAKVPAGRAALMAALLKSRRFDTPLKDLRVIQSPNILAGLTLPSRFERLTSLRKLSLESFHYWNLAAGHLKENQ
jgi:hypothetical protein